MFSAGADQALTIGLNPNTSGLPTLFSHGEQLTYSVVGNVLTASTSLGTVFTLTVNADGSWTFDLDDQLDHVAGSGDTGTLLKTSADGSTSVPAIDFSSIVVATDSDGDSALGAASGGFTITVQNDVPILTESERPGFFGSVEEDGMSLTTKDSAEGNKDAGDDYSQDETSGTAGSLASYVQVGADEPVTFGLSSDTSGLPQLLSGGLPVQYAVDGNVLTATAGGTTVFTFTMYAGGTWSFDLQGQLDHVDDGTNTENFAFRTVGGGSTSGIDLSSVIAITDADGDSVGDLDQGFFRIAVQDDVPTVTITAASGIVAALDESGPGAAATLDTGLVAKGDDPDVAGSNALSRAVTSGAVVNVTALFGADGAAASGQTSYALKVTNAGSGLTLTDGSAIQLVQQANGVVVGVVQSGPFAGQAAFAISIDASTGVVTVEQYLSLDHPTEATAANGFASYDEALFLASGSLGVTVTVTDGDNDQAVSNTADISGQISFDDDGPSVRADRDSVGEDGTTIVSGNVITDGDAIDDDANAGTPASSDGADSLGADGGAVTGVRFGSVTEAVGSVGTRYPGRTVQSTSAPTGRTPTR